MFKILLIVTLIIGIIILYGAFYYYEQQSVPLRKTVDYLMFEKPNDLENFVTGSTVLVDLPKDTDVQNGVFIVQNDSWTKVYVPIPGEEYKIVRGKYANMIHTINSKVKQHNEFTDVDSQQLWTSEANTIAIQKDKSIIHIVFDNQD